MAGPEGCDPGLEAGIAHEPGATEPIPNTTTLLGEPRWKELDDEVVRHLASLGLRVEMSAVKGRSLVALRLFRAGEIVLQQEALAWAFIGSESSRCHECLAPRDNLRRCARCRYAHYCSGDHQKAAWREHSSECRRVARFKEQGKKVTPMTMMLARILDAKAREESTMGLDDRAAAPGLRHCDLLTLAAHLGRHTEENMLGYAQVSLMLAALFHEGPALEGGMDEDADPEDLMADFGWGTGGAARGAPESSGELCAEVGPPSEVGGLIGARELAAGVDMRGAVEILCRIACNGHTITDSDLRPFGVGVFPLAALANHSCAPSCVQSFRGASIVLRAMCDLAPGDEVTIAYVDVATPRAARRSDLEKRYLFTCACDACTDAGSEARESNKEAWREGTVSEDQRDEAVAACADACAAAERGRAGGDELLRILREACAQGEAALDPLHVGLMRAREHALRLAIALADWKEAEWQCAASLPAYRAHYPAGSPLVGLQLATLGKVQALRGSDAAARSSLAEAAPLLLRAFGPGDPALREAEERLREVSWALDGFGAMANTAIDRSR